MAPHHAAVRALLPAALLLAAHAAPTLPALLHLALFLIHTRAPPRALAPPPRYPAPLLLAAAALAAAQLVAHAALAALIAARRLDPAALAPAAAAALALPRYDLAPWAGLRLLVPPLFVAAVTLAALLQRAPPPPLPPPLSASVPSLSARDHAAAPDSAPADPQPRLIVLWFRETFRRPASSGKHGGRLRAGWGVLRHTGRAHSAGLADDDDDAAWETDSDDLATARARRQSHYAKGRHASQPAGADADADATAPTRFTIFMASRGGIFWSAISVGLTGLSYSSLLTFVFLAAFSLVLVAWAFHASAVSPKSAPHTCLRLIAALRLYIIVYLVALSTAQLPWFDHLLRPDSADDSAAKIVRFIGLVPVSTGVSRGWCYVMAMGAATAAYVFTGVFLAALGKVTAAAEHQHQLQLLHGPTVDEEQGGGSRSRNSVDAGLLQQQQQQSHRSVSRPSISAVASPRSSQNLSFYEVQFLQVIIHVSICGLLTWSLVFPGVLTLPMLLSALMYLAFRRWRHSQGFDYLVIYAVALQMVHFLYAAVTDAFGISDSAVVRLLGLRTFNPQFSMNLVQSLALGLLCVNIFSKRYIQRMDVLRPPDERVGVDGAPDQSIRIDDFIHWVVFSAKSKNQRTVYSPVKLIMDQLALASLFVAGGIEPTILNAVFLLCLAVICVSQAFGLFRRRHIFAIMWSSVLIYGIAFLLTTCTVCRAVEGLWRCELRTAGVLPATHPQVVAYAAVVLLAAVQVHFTWPYDSDSKEGEHLHEFKTGFWRVLRKYFLFVAYCTLLLYPLLYPPNFLSYGYMLFLAISILVELLGPSLRLRDNRDRDVRPLVKKYWPLVVCFSCVAMLSRYFVRLPWFDSSPNDEFFVRKWVFGLDRGAASGYEITLGDAIVLIVMSLQGRLFIVDSLVMADGESRPAEDSHVEEDGYLSDQELLYGAEDHNLASQFIASADGEQEAAFLGLLDARERAELRRQRNRSVGNVFAAMEAAANASLLSPSPFLNEHRNSVQRRSYSIPARMNELRDSPPSEQGRNTANSELQPDEPIVPVNGFPSLSSRPQASVSPSHQSGAASRRGDDGVRGAGAQEDMEGHEHILNQARLAQAVQIIRNFRKSLPVKQTEVFLQRAYAYCIYALRAILLRYSYVLQALAILAASVWLPGISLFGAIYILLGCIILLSEQQTARGTETSDLDGLPTTVRASISDPGLSWNMPAALVILSFALMSFQYLFIIVSSIRDGSVHFIFRYLGLRAEGGLGERPISEEAMIAHVLVFVTAFLQRVAVRWAAHDAKVKRTEHEEATDVVNMPFGPLHSTDALDAAVPVGTVLPGTGGSPLMDRSIDVSALQALTYHHRCSVDKLALGAPSGSGGSPSSTTSASVAATASNWMQKAVNAPMLRGSRRARSPRALQLDLAREDEATGDSPTLASGDSQGSDTTFPSAHRTRAEPSGTQKTVRALWRFTKAAMQRVAAVASLLRPFWSNWGFDVTFAYLVIGAATTRTLFSVLYVGFVLLVGHLERAKIARYWHQVSLLLTVLLLVQYALTLGIPTEPTLDEKGDPISTATAWEIWLCIDNGNESSNRQFAITFAFLAVICAGVTLNAVSTGPRSRTFWMRSLNVSARDARGVNGHAHISDGSDDAHIDESEGNNRGDWPEARQPMIAVRADAGPQSGRSLESVSTQGSQQPAINRSFISGLGQPVLQPAHKEADLVLGQENCDLNGQNSFTDYLQKQRESSMSKRLSVRSQNNINKRWLQSRIDPKDFTLRPISFKNEVKLSWMRFAGPAVQLCVFAVAVVDTNLLSGLLLLLAFFFFFQFTNVGVKKSSFVLLRLYVIAVVFALIVYQAPFSSSEMNAKWADIVGLYRADAEANNGRVLLYLMLSLWLLCQMQARIYESKNFRFVEEFGKQDAKARFKRAAHEHNSRKYEKMLGRNRTERSRVARQERLKRLKVLTTTDRSVDALYQVCVEKEMDFLMSQVTSSAKEASERVLFRSHTGAKPDSEEKDPAEDFGFWHRTLRFVIRGKRWREHAGEPIRLELQTFITRYSAWAVYATMLLAAVENPSILTLVYPLVLFLYLIIEQPRPPKQAWTTLMMYVCIVIGFKYIFRSPSITSCDSASGVGFFAPPLADPGQPAVRNLHLCTVAAGIFYDHLVLLALLWHRAILYYRGLWDLQMTEEDMVLRTDIRGQRLETSSDMMFDRNALSDSMADGFKEGINDGVTNSAIFHGEQQALLYDFTTNAEKQYNDVYDILARARKSYQLYIGAKSDGDTVSRNAFPVSESDPRGWGEPAAVPFSTAPHVERNDTKSLRGFFRRRSTQREPLDVLNATVSREPRSQGATATSTAVQSQNNSESHQATSRRHQQRVAFGGSPAGSPPPGQSAGAIPPTPSAASGPLRRSGTLRRIASAWPGLTPTATPDASQSLTEAQSRVQKSLIDSNVISATKGRADGGALSLFNPEKRGFLYPFRQHFGHLLKEHEHKAVGDYYILIFLVDFISFVYVMFGYSAIFSNAGDGGQQTWWSINFIQTKHLLAMLGMFMAIIIDRIVYLTRSMPGKLAIQYASVIIYHIVLFVYQDNIGSSIAAQAFYVLRCIYFLLSGLQIRNGFPSYTTAQYLLRNYSTLGIVMFEIYTFIPFLWLTRTLLDWTVIPTSLEIFQYFRFIDIYIWLYRNRAVNVARGSFKRKLGEKRRWLPRIYQGVGLFLLCVIALFLPFMVFSIFNPFFIPREPVTATLSVNLLAPAVQTESTATTVYPLYSRTGVIGAPLSRAEQAQFAEQLNIRIFPREREQLFSAEFGSVSDFLWQLPAPSLTGLVRELEAYDESRPSRLAFALTASTIKQDFKARALLSLDANQSAGLGNAFASQTSFAMKVLSPLPLYSILQSSSTVFTTYPGNSGETEVCLRLLYNDTSAGVTPGAPFWSLSSCGADACVCEPTITADDESASQYILQVAKVSSIQLGGGTILALYGVILFTIANLFKRFFSDKRLIVPYIDMPYTLHLYQLVLDIMYARQDGNLEMEEILYNGLIDVYRDPHELIRWSGERALKLPSEWWKESEDSDEFMCYPSFLETRTEPYIDRNVE